MKFGIIQERKNPPDRRVVFSPTACQKVVQHFPEAQLVVEPSSIRVFQDREYQEAGIPLQGDVSDCQVLLGVKEVPIEALIPNKKYFFFSHTIKKQPYNRELLRAVLDKHIELYDHEVITAANGQRLVAFGRFAGIVGAYNGIRAYGLKHDIFQLPKAETLEDREALIQELQQISLPAIKIVLSGTGRVGQGAAEILDAMGVQKVDKEVYLQQEFPHAVYCQLDVLDYNQRQDGQVLGQQDFFDNPQAYASTFMAYAQISHLYIAGHFYGVGAPYIFTREDAKVPNFKISVVADISCDIDGPVASTIRPSTIADPIYGYDPKTELEVAFDQAGAIAVMAVDNLPCELPKDASEGFGESFLEHVIPAFFNGDKDGVLARARMTQKGKLTPRFAYLQEYVDGK